ncbi:lipoprotein LpqB [Chlamydia trachomatis]|nr:lipoprotein LpqB [Chlamydia trachomatis]
MNLQSEQVLKFNVPDFADSTIDRIAVSRENSRIVVVAKSNSATRMAVYGAVRDDSGTPLAVGEPLWFGQNFTDVRDIAWVSELRMLVLGSVGRDGAQGLFTLDIGGLSEPVTGVSSVVALTAGRSLDSALVMGSDGTVKGYFGSAWSNVATGVTAIAFPG